MPQGGKFCRAPPPNLGSQSSTGSCRSGTPYPSPPRHPCPLASEHWRPHWEEDPRAWEETTRAYDEGLSGCRTPAPRKGVQAWSWWVSFSPTSHALIVFEGQWGKYLFLNFLTSWGNFASICFFLRVCGQIRVNRLGVAGINCPGLSSLLAGEEGDDRG